MMHDMDKYSISNDYPESTHEIWIADDVLIECRAPRIKWWHRWFIKILFGWTYKRIKK